MFDPPSLSNKELQSVEAFLHEPASDSETMGLRPLGDHECFMLKRTIPTAGWSMVMILSPETVLKSVTESNRAMVAILFFVGLLSLLAVFLTERHVLRPLAALKEVQERIMKGEVSARVTLLPRDELGDLARSFNDMADSLIAASRKLLASETALRESHQRFQDIAATLPGVIYQFYARPDGNMGLHYVGEQSKELFGVEPTNDSFFNDFKRMIHPEDMEGFNASIAEAVAGVSPWSYIGRLQRPDGEWIWFNGISTPQRRTDEIIFNGVLLDITAMKEAELSLREKENQLRGFIEQSLMAVCMTDGNGAVVEWNAAYERLSGMKREEVLGKPLWDVTYRMLQPEIRTKDTLDFMKTRVLLALERGWIEQQQIRITKNIGPKGETLYLEHFSFVIRRGSSNSLAMLLHDVTERVTAEEEIRKRQQRIQRHHEAIVSLNTDRCFMGETWQQAFESTLRLVSEVVEIERLGVWFFDGDETWLECRSLYERTKDDVSSGMKLETARYPTYIKAIRTERVVDADDAQADERTLEFLESYLKPMGITSLLDAPIRLHGCLQGVLCFEHTGPKRTWMLDEISFAGEVADHIERILGMEEQRRSEERRRVQERRLSLAFSASTDAIWDWNLKTDETYFSPRWYTMLGYEDRAFPMHFDTWKVLCHPEDLPGVMERARHVLESEGRQSYSVEYRMRHADGHWVWVLGRGDVVERDEQGTPLVFSGTHTDISKQKMAEETLRSREAWLRTILNSVADAVITVDTLGRVTFLNPVAETLTGWSGKDVLSQTLETVLPVRNAASGKAEPDFYRRIRYPDSSTIHGETLRIASRDGREFPSFITGAPILDETGMASGTVLLFRDVTQQRQEEASLRHQQKLESIGTLAGGVAHEINNPIGIIMLYAERLQLDVPPENPVHEVAGEILAEGQRIATIVRNLLSFSRHEKESHSPAQMQDILRMTLSLVSKLIQKDQVNIELDVDENLPSLKCRSQQIMQVLMNLILNAKDALNEKFKDPSQGEKRIHVSACLVEKDGRRYIRTSVRDNGPGVPPSVRDKIFDPFFTTKGRDRGTGLGLSVSHGIVKDHQGDLWLETQLGDHTVFHVDLPLDNGWTLSGSQA